jgi:rhodanese-related sulfurtransferase
MNMLKSAIIQALAVAVFGSVIACIFNSVSVNGIDPFRKIADVPVNDGAAAGGDDAIRIVTIEETQAAQARGYLILDARTEGEYIEGHIPGALLFDYYELGRYIQEVLPTISTDQELIIYCAGPDCNDSELLARELYLLGYRNLAVFKGGYEAWIDAGLPIETPGDEAL